MEPNLAASDAGVEGISPTASLSIPTDQETLSCEAQSTSSVHQVLNTTELCEQILKDLSLHDLFIAQFICRATQSVIKGSVALQERLFLRAADSMTKLSWDVRSKASPLYAAVDAPGTLQSKPKTSHIIRPLMLNTLILSKTVAPARYQSFTHESILSDLAFKTCRAHSRNEWMELVLCSPARITTPRLQSYRPMFLTQPPVTEVTVLIKPQPKQQSSRKRLTTIKIANSKGVTWDEVINEADRNHGVPLDVSFPGEVAVTPELNEEFEAWEAQSDCD